MKNLVSKAISSEALRQTTSMISGNTIASAISAIALILYSRFLGPETFGVFSVGFSAILLISKLADFGINMALQKYLSGSFEGDKTAANQIIHATAKLKLVTTTVILALFWVMADFIAQALLKTDYPWIIRWAVILALINVAYDYLALVHQAIHNFKQSIWMNISQAAVKAATALPLMWYKVFDPVVVFIAYSLAPLAGVIYGLKTLPAWIKPLHTKPQPKQISQIRHMVTFTASSVIVGALVENIDVLIVKSFLSDYETGLFAAGARLSILIAILGYSLGSVLNSRVPRYSDYRHFRSFYKKAMLLSLAAFMLIIPVVPLTKYLILITAGSQYVVATPAIQLVLAASLITVATTPFVSIFYVISKPQFFMIKSFIQAGFLITANLLLIPIYGIVGAGMAAIATRVAAYIFTIAYSHFAVRAHFTTNVSEARL